MFKRSCRRVKDPVVHVLVRWITETDTANILSVNIYCTSVSGVRQRLAKHEVWNFFKQAESTLKRETKHPQPPNHCPLPTPPLSHSLSLLLQLFSASLIKLKLKSSKDCLTIVCSKPSSSLWWQMAAFPKTMAMTGWAMSSWPFLKSHTDNACL